MRVLKQVFALIFFAFILLISNIASAQSPAMQQFCEEKIGKVVINFTSSYGKLRYDKNRGSKFLKREQQKLKKSTNDWKTLGLSTSNPTLEVSVEVESYSLGGTVCVVPAKIDIFFGYINPTIYIAREIADNKCRRKVVMRHEKTHQQINILALEYFLPQMKSLITKRIKEMKPIYVDKNKNKCVAQQAGEMKDIIVERMTVLVEQFNNFIEKEQSKLDNPENYLFESEICNDEQP